MSGWSPLKQVSAARTSCGQAVYRRPTFGAMKIDFRRSAEPRGSFPSGSNGTSLLKVTRLLENSFLEVSCRNFSAKSQELFPYAPNPHERNNASVIEFPAMFIERTSLHIEVGPTSE